jgi:hypothetical protein
MQKFYYALSLIVLITVISCTKKEEPKPLPTVDFSFSPVNPITLTPVTFTNLCQNATAYSWDFGNGQTSNSPNPSVNYTSGGAFMVILTATGDGGTNKASKTVTVIAPPVADFTFSLSGTRAPSIITFTNTSQNGLSYSWDFGNGQTSTQQNPAPTFAAGGTFSVTLTVTGQGNLINKMSKIITVLPAYTKVGISGVSILNYPATKTDGSNWDPLINGIFPDVYFKIIDAVNGTILYTFDTKNRKEDLRIVDLPFSFTAPTGSLYYLHSNLNIGINVNIYDFDSITSDEFMGLSSFNFRDYVTTTNPYPTTVTVTNAATSLKLTLNWQ